MGKNDKNISVCYRCGKRVRVPVWKYCENCDIAIYEIRKLLEREKKKEESLRHARQEEREKNIRCAKGGWASVYHSLRETKSFRDYKISKTS